jgi:RNA polymerase sigma-70 factor (ECF subfamily)
MATMRNQITDEQLRDLIPRLRRFAFWLTRQEASAEDLVQSCLERALTHGESRRQDGNLRPWLFSILYRQFLDGQRRAKRYARLLEFFKGGEQLLTSSTEDLVLARTTLEGFSKLPAEQRALLLLVTVEGLTYQEAADTLAVPIGTIMSRLSRARKALRELTEGQVVKTPLRILK